MIYVSNELKQAFLGADQKNLVLTFDDGTIIDNDDIAMECMDLEQTLCDTDELIFGKVSSACFKTKISASTKTYKNLWFNASIGVGEYEISLGRFKVYTDSMTSDRLYREIVAYDSLFWATNTDVTEWYNGLTFPITQKAFRDSLFDYLGIEQEEVELLNDSVNFSKTLDVENITGLTVLQNLCEINASWGVINNAGNFKYAQMRTHEHDALYPSDDLYPGDDIYPDDIYDDRLSKGSYFQGTLKYEEYETQTITKVWIREDEDDIGYFYGTDGNTYIIEGNFLLYGATDETLEMVASNFYSNASYISYTPSELKCKGAPWREVGDLLMIIADKCVITVPILNRRMSGITSLKDTYVAKGKETYGELINSPTEQLIKLKSRTNKLTRSLDETKSELKTFETDVNGNFKEVLSAITQTANSIKSEVSETYETKTDASSQYNSLSSTITQTANSIKSEVSEKVGNDEIISKINQSAETVSIDAKKISLEGAVTVNNNVKINTNGTIETKGATLDGTVTSGKIIVTDGYMDVHGNHTSPSGNTPSQILIRPSASTSADSSVMNYLGIYFNSADLSGGRSVELLASRDLIFYTASDKAAWGTWIDETGVWSQSHTVSGTKSRYAETEDYGERLFYCYEMPTPMFGDIGEGKIDETGKCYIFLDDIFTETIDTDCVYQVFLQPYGKGECYITERTSSYFVVEGTTDLSFGWELKAVQKGYDTMRMEVFEKVPKECDTLMETETYLNTMVETDGTIEETETYLDSLANTDGTMEETE